MVIKAMKFLIAIGISLILVACITVARYDNSTEAQLTRIDASDIDPRSNRGVNARYLGEGSMFLTGEINTETLAYIVYVSENSGLEYLIISSAGGFLDESQVLGFLLRELGTTVILPKGSVCGSGCLDTIAAAQYVVAHSSAILIHHTVRFSDTNWMDIERQLDNLPEESREFEEYLIREDLINTEIQRYEIMSFYGINDSLWDDFFERAEITQRTSNAGNVLGMGDYAFGPYYGQHYGFIDKVVR